MLDLFLQPEAMMIFATLFALEVVLGVDNIVFISVLCERLPEHQRKLARNLGIALAVAARIGLVFSISWVMSLTQPLFSIADSPFSGRDLIMIGGGAFLLAKSLKELWMCFSGAYHQEASKVRAGIALVLLQIVAVDAVFSMDSVITAVGMTSEVPLMVAAILASAIVMVLCAEKINDYVLRYPGLKTLALLFLVMLGGMLMAEGFAIHLNKGYVYFAMAFGLLIETCHILLKKRNKTIIRRIYPQQCGWAVKVK
ncbi:membrane protein [Photobacterium angustum]|uniref:TerC family protein n=1 Tax=Photobacterium angustum TaxID=661 RepID=A0ABX5H593_PHOAN|nr:TerC family protein [Photobacterium angustum]KJG38299.1 membrane protein [Photobacterium angustum]PSX11030.1 TerC family protein [Photobacterium angustum]